MPGLAERLRQAAALHQQGQLKAAGEIYAEILKVSPRHPDAMHLLGVVAAQSKNHQLAADLMAEAIAINPENADYFSNRGAALTALKQFEAAVESYDHSIRIKPGNAQSHCHRGSALLEMKQLEAALSSYAMAISLNPRFAQAHYLQGLALKESGQFKAAVASYDKAIELNPGHAEAYFSRANALQAFGQYGAAAASYQQALRIKPEHAEAHSNLGVALQALGQPEAAILSYDTAIRLDPAYAGAYSNRGNALKQLKRLEAAVESYDQAIRINPGYAGAYSNRAVALHELKQLDGAIASIEMALSIQPQHADAWFNRGNILLEQGHFDDALASYDRAIDIRPDYPQAFSSRGNALKELKRLDSALASFDQAIKLDPACGLARLNKSLVLLLKGDFAEGLPLYESRWEQPDVEKYRRQFSQPLWLGKESLLGKTILLHSEQGLGDTLQFCRYASLVAALGATVIAQVPRPLMGVLQGLEGVSQWVVNGAALPAFDYHCPMLSLPLAFNTDLEHIPGSQAYLRSESSKVAEWKHRLGPRSLPRVGLVWSGSPTNSNDHNRSIKLSLLMQHLPLGFEYFCLQKGVRAEDMETIRASQRVRIFDDQLMDFQSTAGLCELMDVVITVCTSLAHLAGALGRPTWVMLRYAPDWRWLLDRDDSPWYASARLYRQSEPKDWTDPLEKIRHDLLAYSAG